MTDFDDELAAAVPHRVVRWAMRPQEWRSTPDGPRLSSPLVAITACGREFDIEIELTPLPDKLDAPSPQVAPSCPDCERIAAEEDR